MTLADYIEIFWDEVERRVFSANSSNGEIEVAKGVFSRILWYASFCHYGGFPEGKQNSIERFEALESEIQGCRKRAEGNSKSRVSKL